MFPSLSLSKLRSFADTWTFSFPDMTWCKFSMAGVDPNASRCLHASHMLSINQKHSFCRCVQWRFSFVQTIATSSRSVCWPVKLEFFASLRQFCAFKISTKQSLPFSQMILQFFCRFLNVTLFSRGPRVPILQMGVHVCWVLYLFGPSFFEHLSPSNPWRPSHLDTHMSKSCKMPGESWEWCSTMIQWSMTQPMSPCALRSNARKSKAVIVWCILGKGEAQVGAPLRCMCEQTSEKAASCGTIQCPWHICLDVGAGRSQMGLRT